MHALACLCACAPCWTLRNLVRWELLSVLEEASPLKAIPDSRNKMELYVAPSNWNGSKVMRYPQDWLLHSFRYSTKFGDNNEKNTISEKDILIIMLLSRILCNCFMNSSIQLFYECNLNWHSWKHMKLQAVNQIYCAGSIKNFISSSSAPADSTKAPLLCCLLRDSRDVALSLWRRLDIY